MHQNLGLAHLSALHLSPPDLVVAAANAGFSSVGVRVFPATRGETRYPMAAGSQMLRQTCERLEDTNVKVNDIEAFTLNGKRDRNDWLPALETGSALGARVLNVICGDPEPARLEEGLTSLVRDAQEHGIRASIEPISYQPVSTVEAATRLSRRTGCGIMLDVLHFMRGENTLADLESIPREHLTCIQLSDGPHTPPQIQPPRSMPLHQSVAGTSLQLESRVQRMPPNRGVFPLIEILQALPEAPISVEVPDVHYVEEHDSSEHLRRLNRAAVKLLDAVLETKANNPR